jgi:hypothetical protein
VRIAEPLLAPGLARDVVAELVHDAMAVTRGHTAGAEPAGQIVEPAHPITASTACAKCFHSRRRTAVCRLLSHGGQDERIELSVERVRLHA